MTETELTDRLREAIVLDGPDVWQTNGYLQDAQQAGIPLADALKRANEISQEVTNNTLLFQNIQARIARMAQPSRSQMIEQDLAQIVNAATSLKLSADFVRSRWVPTVLQRLAAAASPKPVEPLITPPPVVTPLPVVTPPPVAKPNAFEILIDNEPIRSQPEVPVVKPPVSEPVITVRADPPPVVVVPPVYESSSSYTEPDPIVRFFTATPARIRKGQAVTLAWDVENLLAVTIDDLGEGLSPQNRGWVKPTKTTDYTLFDANDNPLSTVRVEVIPRDRSGVYGVLFALVLLAIIYWFIKSGNTENDTPKPTRKTDQTTSSIRKEDLPETSTVSHQEPEPTSEATDTPQANIETTDKPKADVSPIRKPSDESVALAEPKPKPATPTEARVGKYEEPFGDKPYDKVELGPDEHGWRRARSKGRWGYVNEDDEWVIQPEFEAVTPFKGNTASVFLNGQLMTINRSGEQVRN